jgi:hypothetical protein
MASAAVASAHQRKRFNRGATAEAVSEPVNGPKPWLMATQRQGQHANHLTKVRPQLAAQFFGGQLDVAGPQRLTKRCGSLTDSLSFHGGIVARWINRLTIRGSDST